MTSAPKGASGAGTSPDDGGASTTVVALADRAIWGSGSDAGAGAGVNGLLAATRSSGAGNSPAANPPAICSGLPPLIAIGTTLYSRSRFNSEVDYQRVLIKEIGNVTKAGLELARQDVELGRLEQQGDQRQVGNFDLK